MSNPQPCTKAIIAMAGYGTRRLPVTKAVEKCLLPVGNRPIIDYVVDPCVAAGITDIILVVGEQSEQVRTYYGSNERLEAYLRECGKRDLLATVRSQACKARFTFIVQDDSQPYGTSTPLWLAKGHIGPDEPFLYLYGDNIFYTADGSSPIASFLTEAQAADTAASMLAVEVPAEEVSNYGIVAMRRAGDIELFERIVEKPLPEEAPSNLNNAGCFLFRPSILPYVQRSIERSPQKEKYVTDAINWYAEDGNSVAVLRLRGEYLDCGNVSGWLHANNRIVGQGADA